MRIRRALAGRGARGAVNAARPAARIFSAPARSAAIDFRMRFFRAEKARVCVSNAKAKFTAKAEVEAKANAVSKGEF